MRADRLERAVRDACERMGVELLLSGAQWPPDDRRWHAGPASASLSIGGQPAIFLDSGWQHSEGWIHALHELEHLVFYHPEIGLDVGESLMMPWAVGVLRASGVPGTAYMGSMYTRSTALDSAKNRNARNDRSWVEVGDWKCPERSWWYKMAVRAQIAGGTLGPDLLPTWQRPDWSRINVEEHP